MIRFVYWLFLSAVVIALDQGSKLAVLAHFVEGEALDLSSFFTLRLVFNPGAAFSLLADHPEWGRWFFIALAAVICSYLLTIIWRHRSEFLQPAASALIVGGAIGNVIDRFAYGRVVDFLDFHYLNHHYPAFNLADSAICLGVMLIILTMVRNRPTQSKVPL